MSSSCQCSNRAHQRCIRIISTTIVAVLMLLMTTTTIHSLPTCKSCGAPPSDLSFCAAYIPAGSSICIQDNYKDVETNISNVYSSNGTIVPYEICYSVCKDYAYGCWARDEGAINWALQPVWDVAEQNKKLDYFCSTEVGNPSPCSLGGKAISSGNSFKFSVSLALACLIGLLAFHV
ncbi:hypothetical protein C9374_008162 [Naegleria lovaniensis]|uniref:Uncharacterized protein n=1 Tax=Naegleria lovaniensis TaxID=51637 RepID=A0AA88KI53_NAELO|nr:uncharacterized protein C9374_008162 [Naegleria lovaniensis]KAG2378523.1 hypothetical protein C9374_008162 [Naegleria lovaniensis]